MGVTKTYTLSDSSTDNLLTGKFMFAGAVIVKQSFRASLNTIVIGEQTLALSTRALINLSARMSEAKKFFVCSLL